MSTTYKIAIIDVDSYNRVLAGKNSVYEMDKKMFNRLKKMNLNYKT